MQHHRRSKVTLCGYFPQLDAIFAPETSLNRSDTLTIAQANCPRTSGVPRTHPFPKHTDICAQRRTHRRSLPLSTIIQNHFEDDATGGKHFALYCDFRKAETLPFDMTSSGSHPLLANPSYMERSDNTVIPGVSPIARYSTERVLGPDFGRAHGTAMIECDDDDISVGFLNIFQNITCLQEQSQKPQSNPMDGIRSKIAVLSAKSKKSGENALVYNFRPTYKRHPVEKI